MKSEERDIPTLKGHAAGAIPRNVLHREVFASPWIVLFDWPLDAYRHGWTCRDCGDEESVGLEKVPVIAVTSYAMMGDREKILAAGATGYVEKPIDPNTFVADIIQYLPKDQGDEERLG